MRNHSGKVLASFKSLDDQDLLAKGRVHVVPKEGQEITVVKDWYGKGQETWLVTGVDWGIVAPDVPDDRMELEGNIIGYYCTVWLMPADALTNEEGEEDDG